MLRRSTLMRIARALLGAAAVVVCLFPLQAQVPNATVLELNGNVSVMSDGYQTPLFVGGTVKQQQMIVTGPDGYAKFRVSSDTTKFEEFEVFPNSRIIFREHPGAWEELLDILLGRIKVFIHHAPGQVNHNSVSSPTAVISVRGTVFDVVVQDADGTTVVNVDEGIVAVRNITSYQVRDVELHPGESITVSRGVPLLAGQVNRTQPIQFILKGARDALWQVIFGRRGGPLGIPGAGGSGGAQGDKPKPGGTGTGAPGTGPGASSTGPGAPSTGPAAPGGSGH